MRLKDKVIVVTGAAAGMGKAMAELFLKEGASVVLGDWNEKKLNVLLDELHKTNSNVFGKCGDISKRSDAEALIDLAFEKFGRVDVLVNNAGVMDQMAGIDELDDDTWNRMLNINITGPMYAARRAIQSMLKNHNGSIINVASTAANHGSVAGVAYTTSKHAMIGFTKNTAWMYAQKGIRCNVICPGATNTSIMESVAQDRMSQLGAERLTPVHKLSPATLESLDIAHLALFLASDESKMISGAIVNADGGWGAM